MCEEQRDKLVAGGPQLTQINFALDVIIYKLKQKTKAFWLVFKNCHVASISR